MCTICLLLLLLSRHCCPTKRRSAFSPSDFRSAPSNSAGWRETTAEEMEMCPLGQRVRVDSCETVGELAQARRVSRFEWSRQCCPTECCSALSKYAVRRATTPEGMERGLSGQRERAAPCATVGALAQARRVSWLDRASRLERASRFMMIGTRKVAQARRDVDSARTAVAAARDCFQIVETSAVSLPARAGQGADHTSAGTTRGPGAHVSTHG